MPIFSAEPVFMGPWIQTNAPLLAFTNYSLSFNNETGTWKSNILLGGYLWFAHSFMPENLSSGIRENWQEMEILEVYPNPVVDTQSHITGNKSGTIILNNSTGEIIKTFAAEQNITINIETTCLKNGLYSVRFGNSVRNIVVMHR